MKIEGGARRVFVLSAAMGSHTDMTGVWTTVQDAKAFADAEDAKISRSPATVWTAIGLDIHHGHAEGEPSYIRWVIEPWDVQ